MEERKYINTFAFHNIYPYKYVGMNTICLACIDMIQALTMDGFLQHNHVLSQWFHEKYPTCTLYNYKEQDRMIIGRRRK